MAPPLLDRIEQTLRSTYNHITGGAGSFNEGQPNQVSGEDLPPKVKLRVDRLAEVRNSLENLNGPENLEHKRQLQKAINYLYNPSTRAAAMAAWEDLGGDENNQWSATGGKLPVAAQIVNDMLEDPDHYLYGGVSTRPRMPATARVSSDEHP